MKVPTNFVWHPRPGAWLRFRLFMLDHLNLLMNLSLSGSDYNLSTTVAVAIPCPMHIVCSP
jgi:hypothetical protein